VHGGSANHFAILPTGMFSKSGPINQTLGLTVYCWAQFGAMNSPDIMS
jgi:hypothetical protein